MKKILPFILIGAFLFPAFGHVFAATASTETPAVAPIIVGTTDVNAQLHSILSRFTTLSIQTQTTIDQLSLNDIDTTKAQTSLDSAKIDISKAKTTLATPKYSTKIAETQLEDTRTDILQSLAYLKASLPILDKSGQ